MLEFNSKEKVLTRSDGATVRSHISYKNYLNLGCGELFHPDWLNIDIFPSTEEILQRDLRVEFPLPDSSIDLLYSSHLFHLLNEYDAHFFLNQCFRCMRPGGIIRLVVPDEEIAAEKYLEKIRRLKNEKFPLETGDTRTPLKVEKTILQPWGAIKILRQARELSIRMVLTKKQYHQLQFGRQETSLSGVKSKYDFHTLSFLFKEHGFETIKRCAPDESSVADWESFLLDLDATGRPHHEDSLYIEARKPIGS